MRKLNRGFKNAALMALLGGCVAIPSFIDKNAEVTLSESRPSISSNKYGVEFIEYEKYNPIITDTRRISLDDCVIDVLENGLDVFDNDFREKIKIENIFAFRNFLYQEAEKLGHREEVVKTYNPKQVIDLIHRIIAGNVNYAGCSEDNKTKTDRGNRLDNYRNDLEAVVKGNYEEEYKISARDKLKILDKIQETAGQLYRLEDQISEEHHVILARKQDKDPIDVNLMRGDSIVCRKYSDIFKGALFTFRLDNPKLRNTYSGPYTTGIITRTISDGEGNLKRVITRHCFNQVATVLERDGKPHLDITFTDSTFYDSGGNGEGLNGDLAHFRDISKFGYAVDWGILDRQIKKLNDKISSLPVQSRPSISISSK